MTKQTVSTWRGRFVRARLEGLLDALPCGAPRTIDDERVEAAVTTTLETLPAGATHRNTPALAPEMGMSQYGLQPNRQGTFKLSTDPMFIEKVHNIARLYLNLPLMEVVHCVDEKSQIKARDCTQPKMPLAPGMPERRTSDLVRHSTTTLFVALNVETGKTSE